MYKEQILALAKTPRTVTKDLLDLAPADNIFAGIKSLIFGASQSEKKKAETAPLVLVAVVQANRALYDPEETQWAPAFFVWSNNPKVSLDFDWLKQLSDRIAQLRYQETGDAALDRLGSLLRDVESSVTHDPVPMALTNGIQAWCYTGYIGPDSLPGGVIPESGILPALLFSGKELDPTIVPPQCYGAPVHRDE